MYLSEIRFIFGKQKQNPPMKDFVSQDLLPAAPIAIERKPYTAPRHRAIRF